MRRNFIGSGNDGFVCKHCGQAVKPLTSGSYRNHCPFCLYSKHVDVIPGDRLATCHGLMEPIAVDQSAKKGWILIHQCEACGKIQRNKAALEDREPDSYEKLIVLASSV